ncbi:MAG: hypothetical protein WD969_01935 [Paracoccaceae bacterium]
MMRALIGFLFFLAPAAAGAVSNYADCIALAERDAERARNEAAAWFSVSGALGALHCEAQALAALGADRTAAEKLEALAGAPELGAEERAAVLTQAGSLYRREGDRAAARRALDAAHRAAGGGVAGAGVLVERAALSAEADDFAGAKLDLDSALRLRPDDAETLALRAAARRRLGDPANARRDALRALDLEPDHAPARLELGMAEADLGAHEAARAAFLATITAAPTSPTAGMARAALQDMDAPSASRQIGEVPQLSAESPASPPPERAARPESAPVSTWRRAPDSDR